MRYAVIERATANVVNTIELDDVDAWTPPEGHYIVASEEASIGQRYVNRRFVAS